MLCDLCVKNTIYFTQSPQSIFAKETQRNTLKIKGVMGAEACVVEESFII
jgi:hypothetical protein